MMNPYRFLASTFLCVASALPSWAQTPDTLRYPISAATVGQAVADARESGAVDGALTVVGAPTYTTVAAKGGVVAGAGQLGTLIPAGAVWSSLGLPSLINEDLALGLLGTYKVGTTSTRLVGYRPDSASEFVPMGTVGEPIVDWFVEPFPGVTIKAIQEPVFSSNAAFYIATLSGTGITAQNDVGLYFNDRTGLNYEVLREGGFVPDGAGAVWKAVTSIVCADQTVFFTATLQSAGVTAANNTGLFAWQSGELQTIWREGQTELVIDDELKPVKSLKALYAVSGSPGHGRLDRDANAIIALVTYPNGATEPVTVQFGFYVNTLGAVLGTHSVANAKVVKAGIACHTDGTNLSRYFFLGKFQSGLGGVTSANDTAILGTQRETVEQLLIAREGDASGVGATVFKSFQDPVAGGHNEPGDETRVGFIADVAGVGVTAASNTGIWEWREETNSLVALAIEGGEAPGGGHYKSFTSLAMLTGRGVLFSAELADATTSDNTGLWAVDSVGDLRKLLREGDDLGSGRVVKTLKVLGAVAGSSAQTRAFPGVFLEFGPNGVAALVDFTNGGREIIIIGVP